MRKIYIRIVIIFFAAIIFILQYKKPKEYLVLEDAVIMHDEAKGKTIEVTCELYLQYYFLKAAEVKGNIYIDGVKYQSLFDLKQFTSVAQGFSNSNDFFAKLRGEIYAVDFVNEEHWNRRRNEGFFKSIVSGEACIRSLAIDLDERRITFLFFDENGSLFYFEPMDE